MNNINMPNKKVLPNKRVLPKLMACMTRTSLEEMRNKTLFRLQVLDAKGIRRRKLPLHECLIAELKETGFLESSQYMQDLLYDNAQLMEEDEIGIVVDLRKREDYLEHVCSGLQKAEKAKDRGNKMEESMHLLELALFYAEQGKGILWLAEKLFLAAIAVSSQYLIDGGRQRACCKFHYAKFLLDKFPEADEEEAYQILADVRDAAIGKEWLLKDDEEGGETLFHVTAIQLNRVLLSKSRKLRKEDTGKSERLARLAERRARDANETAKTADAIIDIGICQLMMNNLNNAQKTLEKAYKIHEDHNDVTGICEAKMHLSAVMQKLGDHETAARLLTEMGALAMEHNLRRQLGRALHLLGELHLRRERPELGTQHLAEAFTCFMGFGFEPKPAIGFNVPEDQFDASDQIFTIKAQNENEIYLEEAEQSRLMMAISAGQELMAGYFDLLREASVCSVAQMKIIEWKLCRAGWWVKRRQHDTLPCLCPAHKRTPLDCLWIQLELRARSAAFETISGYLQPPMLERIHTTSDITKLADGSLK